MCIPGKRDNDLHISADRKETAIHRFKVVRDGLAGLQPFSSEGGSEGYSRTTLVSLADGSTHVEISICLLEPGGFISAHLHPFEESFFVLSGEAIMSIDRESHHLTTNDFGFAPVAAPHAWANPFDTAVTWYQVRSPQPRPVGEFNGTYPLEDYPIPSTGRPIRELNPRSRYLGHFDLSDMSPPGPLTMPGTHGHNIRNVSVRMMVDDVLGAIHHQTFMVKFEPPEGDYFSGSAHYHNFEEAYYVVSGEGETELEGERFKMRSGDLAWVASGTMHAWRATGDEPLRFIELMAPRPPYRDLMFSEATWREPVD